MKKIAITGGIAEGKSTVLAIIREFGYSVISADDVAREVFLTEEVTEAIAALLAVPAPVDSQVLRDAISKDPSLRRQINHIMHRPILDRILNDSAQFVEVPLLIEAVMNGFFREVWVVSAGADVQLARLNERYADEQHARRLLETQLSGRVKTVFADRVFRTNHPLPTVRQELAEALAEVMH